MREPSILADSSSRASNTVWTCARVEPLIQTIAKTQISPVDRIRMRERRARRDINCPPGVSHSCDSPAPARSRSFRVPAWRADCGCEPLRRWIRRRPASRRAILPAGRAREFDRVVRSRRAGWQTPGATGGEGVHQPGPVTWWRRPSARPRQSSGWHGLHVGEAWLLSGRPAHPDRKACPDSRQHPRPAR